MQRRSVKQKAKRLGKQRSARLPRGAQGDRGGSACADDGGLRLVFNTFERQVATAAWLIALKVDESARELDAVMRTVDQWKN